MFLFLSIFIIFSCDILHRKNIYYADVDFNISIPIGTRIYYSDLYVGRVSKIFYCVKEREKVIEFYLFEEFLYIAKKDSVLILKTDEVNNIKMISIHTNSEDSVLLPERGYFNSTIEIIK